MPIIILIHSRLSQYEAMKVMKIDGQSVRYIDTLKDGDKDSTVLLLHGLGGCVERWINVIPFLSRYYRLLVPDIIGFGYSDKPHVEYTVAFFLKFISTFLKRLDIKDFSIIGSSFGGLLALEYAIKFSTDIKKLILISPAGMSKHITPAFERYIHAALYPNYETVSKAYKGMMYKQSSIKDSSIKDFMNRMKLPNAKYAFMSTLLNLKNAIELNERLDINIPTLIIWGRNDKVLPIRYAEKFKIPNHKFTIFEQCGHYPHVEKFQEFNQTVFKFLNSELY